MFVFRPSSTAENGPRKSGPWAAALAGALLLANLAPLAANEANEAEARGPLKLAVRVFRVPKEQSFEALSLDGRGRPVPFQASGDVTSSFPRATLFFETELAANASESAVASAILDRVPFGAGAISPKRIRLDELKSVELTIDRGRPTAEAVFEESKGEGRTSNYLVRAELMSGGKGKALVRLRFDAGWSATGGRIGVGISEDVVSAPFEVPESKLLLIGAIASGTVYWIAVTFLGN